MWCVWCKLQSLKFKIPNVAYISKNEHFTWTVQHRSRKGTPSLQKVPLKWQFEFEPQFQWITFTRRHMCSLLWAPQVPKMVRWWWHCLIASRNKAGRQDLKVSCSGFKPQSKISSYSFPIFPIFGTVVSHLQHTHSFWSSLYSGDGDDGNYGVQRSETGHRAAPWKTGEGETAHARLDWWFPYANCNGAKGWGNRSQNNIQWWLFKNEFTFEDEDFCDFLWGSQIIKFNDLPWSQLILFVNAWLSKSIWESTPNW